MNANRDDNEPDLGDDLAITKMSLRVAGGGTWVIGTIAGHRFNALVFPEHAERPEYELGGSQISKLWLQRIADKTTVVNFDRGWDVEPKTTALQAIVDFLAGGLADYVYQQ